jgi:hypothetical protein
LGGALNRPPAAGFWNTGTGIVGRPSWGIATIVGVGLAVDVGVGLAVEVGVAVDVAVGVAVEVGVSVDVGVGVAVDVEVGVGVKVGVGVNVGVGVSGAWTVIGAEAWLTEVPPEDETKLVVLVSVPGTTPRTFTVKVQVLFAGMVALAIVTREVLIVAVIVGAPQFALTEVAPVWAIVMLAGRVSLMPTAERTSARLGLLMLNVRSVVAPTRIGDAAKALLTVGART